MYTKKDFGKASLIGRYKMYTQSIQGFMGIKH